MSTMNPLNPYGGTTPPIEQMIGNAYDNVRKVANNLPTITAVANNKENIDKAALISDDVLTLKEEMIEAVDTSTANANTSTDAKNDAVTAATTAASLVGSVSKAILTFPSLFEAQAAAATLPDGQEVIARDVQELYRVQGGVLVFVEPFGVGADLETPEYFGGAGDGIADDLTAISRSSRFQIGKVYRSSDLPMIFGREIYGSGGVIQIDPGIFQVSDPVLRVTGDLTLSGHDSPAVNAISVIAVDPIAETFSVAVESTEGLLVGRFAFITGVSKRYRGMFKILSVRAGEIVLEGWHSKMTVEPVVLSVKPINTIVKLNPGSSAFTVVGCLRKLSNIAIDATEVSHGLVAGSPMVTGQRKSFGEIIEANFVGVYGGTTVGISASTSGVIGVNKIAATKSGIGIASFHCGVIVGNGAYVHDCTGDLIKSEASSTIYINDYTATRSRTQACLASRYTSFMEMDQGYTADASVCHGLAQFNTYLSVRRSKTEGVGMYSLYATAGGHIVTNENELRDSTVNSIRAIGRSRFVGVGANTNTFPASGTALHIENSDVAYNGVTYSGREVSNTVSVGSVGPATRAAFSVSVTGLNKSIPHAVTIHSDIPAGIVFNSIQSIDGVVRLIFQNTSQAAVSVGDVSYMISY